MRLRKKLVWAKINSRGQLDFFKGELDAFCRLHPNRNAIIRVEILPIEASEKTKGYYYGYVVPTIARGFYELGERLTEEQVDIRLRTECPITLEEKFEKGGWKKRAKDFDSLDSAEVNEFIEWIKEYASENLSIIIDEPNG